MQLSIAIPTLLYEDIETPFLHSMFLNPYYWLYIGYLMDRLI